MIVFHQERTQKTYLHLVVGERNIRSVNSFVFLLTRVAQCKHHRVGGLRERNSLLQQLRIARRAMCRGAKICARG